MSTDRSGSSPLPMPPTNPPTPPSAQVQIQQNQTEPQPKATYEEVVSDERLFMETLGDLHKSLGTKFMVPTIGGKPLDLHRLFGEVTSRGGLERVIRDRKWKEVISVFSFPPTITSASFVLRKYYISLLQSYEQVYFFRNRNSKIPPNGVEPESIPGISPAELSKTSDPEVLIEYLRGFNFLEKPPLGTGYWVDGKITGKFEDGYIVKADYGSQTLNGVLYHVPLHAVERESLISALYRRCERKRPRPTATKNESDYKVFYHKHYHRLKLLYRGDDKAINEHIANLWNDKEAVDGEKDGRAESSSRAKC